MLYQHRLPAASKVRSEDRTHVTLAGFLQDVGFTSVCKTCLRISVSFVTIKIPHVRLATIDFNSNTTEILSSGESRFGVAS